MEENVRESSIGEYKLYLDEDNIINVIAVGETDEKLAISIKEAGIKLLNMVEGKANILIDLNKAGKSSPEAKKIKRELTEHERTGKVAFIGIHPVAKVIASFFIGITRKKDISFFKKKKDALAWLKE